MPLTTTRSQELFLQAREMIPGGVNSPVRAFKAVGGNPVYIRSGKGARIRDVDGNEYVDYVCSWGPLILGHTHPAVVKRVQEVAESGLSFGATCELELRMASLLLEAFPSMELVRMVNSGTEAAMSALRLARGFTGREKILKFEGSYHGHSDMLLAKAGSGVMTLGVPDSLGVPESIALHTIVCPYNDTKAFRKVVEQEGEKIAAVIVEPVAGNMGVVPPREGFLETLRETTRKFGIVLIFDEVITGFRLAWGGAQERFGISADLTCLGKIIGGGLPVGAYGGCRDIMEQVAPLGGVYQAGTLSGNPLALAAGIQTLEEIKSQPAFYETLEKRTAYLAEEADRILNGEGIAHRTNRVGSMFTVFFTGKDVGNYSEAKGANTEEYARFFNVCLEHGLYFAPSQFEAAFVSSAHSDAEIEATLSALKKVAASIA